MIIVFSDNNYIEYALKGLELYKELGVLTVNDLSQVNTNGILVIVDEKVMHCEDFSVIITISHKPSSDLQKPFHISALINLINKKLKMLNNYVFPDSFSFFFDKRLLANKQNQLLNLTEKEASLLKYLLKISNCFVSKKKILQEIWQHNSDLETTTLETHLYHLKSKFKKLAIPDIIEMQKDKVKINI